MDNLLVNSEKYEGKFVLLDDFEHKNILFYSDNENDLIEKIEENNISSTHILYVPDSSVINIL